MSQHNQDCKFCTYEWISRVINPKSCPRCKRRFDYEEAKWKIVDFKKMLREAGI